MHIFPCCCLYLDIGLETDGRLPEDILEVAGSLLGHELEVLVLGLAGELVRELGGLRHLLRKPRSVEQLVTAHRACKWDIRNCQKNKRDNASRMGQNVAPELGV